MPASLLLDATEGLIQRQFRRVERLNRLDAQDRHAGIKPRGSGNEKRGERFLPLLPVVNHQKYRLPFAPPVGEII
jgi:hypothetical protein